MQNATIDCILLQESPIKHPHPPITVARIAESCDAPTNRLITFYTNFSELPVSYSLGIILNKLLLLQIKRSNCYPSQ